MPSHGLSRSGTLLPSNVAILCGKRSYCHGLSRFVTVCHGSLRVGSFCHKMEFPTSCAPEHPSSHSIHIYMYMFVVKLRKAEVSYFLWIAWTKAKGNIFFHPGHLFWCPLHVISNFNMWLHVFQEWSIPLGWSSPGQGSKGRKNPTNTSQPLWPLHVSISKRQALLGHKAPFSNLTK